MTPASPTVSPTTPVLVVTSCAAYAPTTLPPLFRTLHQAGVPMSAVVVVIAQCAPTEPLDEVRRVCEGARVVTVEYAAEALTGVIRVSEGGLVDSPWFVYIQDCSLVGPTFWSKACALHKAVADRPLDVVKLLDVFSLSVGMYRTAWVESVKDRLSPLRVFGADDNAIKKIKEDIEDAAFKMAPAARTVYLGGFENKEDRCLVGKFSYPGSATERIVEHYPSLDYFKLKSWWGQAWKTMDDGTQVPIIPVGV